MKMKSLRLRLAGRSEVPAIKRFYLDGMRHKTPEEQEAFPIPSLLEIVNAVDAKEFIVLEDTDVGRIVAASGIFRLVDHDRGKFGELSGMLTGPEVGGVEPLRIQEIMIAARIARALPEILDRDAPTALASFVKRTNAASHDNLRRRGLEELRDPPPWLLDEYVSWFGWGGGDAWRCMRVGLDALREAATIIATLESGGPFSLQRPARNGGTEQFRLTWERTLWGANLTDLRNLLASATRGDLPPLAAEVRFG